MPDHFHLILHPSRRETGSVPLSEIMQAIKGATSHRINKLSGRTGSFWLEENYTRMIRCPVEYQWTWHYIRCNPIVAEFVERPEEWPWWWSRR
jgi:REP element-mobilizing transposase RayT